MASDFFWAWKSRHRGGRPKTDVEVRALVRQMAEQNHWGAPRIHGELLKLGYDVSQANPTAQWTAQQLIEAFPYETVPRYQIRDRDCVYGANIVARVRGRGIEEVLTAPKSPWQSPYVERLMGSGATFPRFKSTAATPTWTYSHSALELRDRLMPQRSFEDGQADQKVIRPVTHQVNRVVSSTRRR